MVVKNLNNTLLSILNIFFHGTFHILFILLPFTKCLRYDFKKTFLLIAIYTISTTLIYQYLNIVYQQFSFVIIAIWILGTISTFLYLVKVRFIYILFVIFLSINVQNNVTLISRLICKLNLLPAINTDSYYVVSLVVLMTFAPFLWYLINDLFKKVIDKKIDMQYWKYLGLIPLVYFIFFNFSFASLNNQPELITVSNLIIVILFNICAYLTYVITLKMLLQTYTGMKEKELVMLTEKQVSMQKEQYESISSNIQNKVQVHNNMKKYIIEIKDFLKKEDYLGLDLYLDKYMNIITNATKESLCEKKSVDSILSYYLSKAKNNDIIINTSIDLPADFNVDDSDLCIVFGNLLENALESCQRQTTSSKFIMIKVRCISKKMLAIVIQNSYEGNIILEDGVFKSAKYENKAGIGLSSVKSIAEKYDGSCKFVFNNNIFKAYVLLNADS